MSEMIAEILEHNYDANTLSKVAKMFGSFPVGDPIRQFANGYEQLEQAMAGVTPLLSRADAVRALIPYMNGSHSEHIHTLADRIRAAASPPRQQPAFEALGSGVARRLIRGPAGVRRGARLREDGCY